MQKWSETQHKKTKIMATGPITSWEIEGEDMEAVTDFTFLGSVITADGASSHEITTAFPTLICFTNLQRHHPLVIWASGTFFD